MPIINQPPQETNKFHRIFLSHHPNIGKSRKQKVAYERFRRLDLVKNITKVLIV